MATALMPAIGWIVVEQQEVSEVTAGGIIKPATAVDREREISEDDRPKSMTVVAVPEEADSCGALTDEVVRYPEIGAQVMVMVKPGTALKYGKRQAIVRIDAVVCEVRTFDGN
jgi:co-chaperonin GroES (HSP10)